MIAIIAAYDRNRTIGRDGRMPWRIPGEQRRFRELTTGAAVVMGRVTWEGLKGPLPERLNVVLSRDPGFTAAGCPVAHSLEEALALAGGLDVYISGGAQVYAQALPLAQWLYLTEIDAEFPGDAFFPEFDRTRFELVSDEPQNGVVPYCYRSWRRI